MHIYPINIAIPAVKTRTIGSVYACMIIQAKAAVINIIINSKKILTQ